MDRPNNAGACTGNLSCVYTHTISWRSKTQPLPMEWNPRAVFETLFGDSGSTDREARQARMRQHKSLLDAVTGKLADLKRELGVQDQVKLDEYTESVRDVERRIQRAEEQSDLELPEMRQPQGAPARLRGSPGADARSAAPGVPVGPDPRHHVHDRQGAECAPLPADRGAGGAPSALAPQQPAGAGRPHVEDQPLPRGALLEVRGEAAGDPGRRRQPARPHDHHVWDGSVEQHAPLGRQPADHADRRRAPAGCRAAGTSSTGTSRRWPTCCSR